MRGFYHYKPRPLHARRVRAQGTRWKLVACGAALLVGVLAGALAEEQGRADGQAYITFFVQRVLRIYGEASFTGVMGFAFLSAFMLQGMVLFFSFSSIGAPAILLFPAVKGVFIGCVSAWLFGTMGLRGAAEYLLLLWLPQTAEACLLVLFSERALTLSLALFRTTLRSGQANAADGIRTCVKAFLYTSFGLLAAAMLTGLFSALFAPIFLS